MGHQLGHAGNTGSEILYKCLSEKNSCVSGLLFLLQVIEIDHDTTLTWHMVEISKVRFYSNCNFFISWKVIEIAQQLSM